MGGGRAPLHEFLHPRRDARVTAGLDFAGMPSRLCVIAVGDPKALQRQPPPLCPAFARPLERAVWTWRASRAEGATYRTPTFEGEWPRLRAGIGLSLLANREERRPFSLPHYFALISLNSAHHEKRETSKAWPIESCVNVSLACRALDCTRWDLPCRQQIRCRDCTRAMHRARRSPRAPAQASQKRRALSALSTMRSDHLRDARDSHLYRGSHVYPRASMGMGELDPSCTKIPFLFVNFIV